jgi:tRNA threonylcarbamoyladenosine biosynthesis protein TsaE
MHAPHPPESIQIECPDELTTEALAHRLASMPALRNLTIWLHGDLGAGKTTWVRHLLRGLGVTGRIKSPTYAIVELHEAPPGPDWPEGLAIAHFDFYRFSDPREWEDAGFRELLAGPGLKLVEWPEKAGTLLRSPDLDIHIDTVNPQARLFRIGAGSRAGQSILREWSE